MENYFKKSSLQEYLEARKPLAQRNIFKIMQLTDGKSSNHLNYKIVTSDGIFVARIVKPGDLLNYTNLADEFLILKLIESYCVGPRVFMIDLEGFQSPILFEEYVDGLLYDKISESSEEIFRTLISLLVKTSEIKLGQHQFPFKFTYTTYMTNFRAWDMRLGEIEKAGVSNDLLLRYKEIIRAVKKYLEGVDSILRSAKKEFIYNDVHPGNIFWLPKEKVAKFIDWQKVSLGDPTFMAALCARRFNSLVRANTEDFAEKVLTAYSKQNNIQNFETLFYARILERAVSDMIWETWATLKRGLSIGIQSSEESKYFKEAKEYLQRLRG